VEHNNNKKNTEKVLIENSQLHNEKQTKKVVTKKHVSKINRIKNIQKTTTVSKNVHLKNTKNSFEKTLSNIKNQHKEEKTGLKHSIITKPFVHEEQHHVINTANSVKIIDSIMNRLESSNVQEKLKTVHQIIKDNPSSCNEVSALLKAFPKLETAVECYKESSVFNYTYNTCGFSQIVTQSGKLVLAPSFTTKQKSKCEWYGYVKKDTNITIAVEGDMKTKFKDYLTMRLFTSDLKKSSSSYSYTGKFNKVHVVNLKEGFVQFKHHSHTPKDNKKAYFIVMNKENKDYIQKSNALKLIGENNSKNFKHAGFDIKTIELLKKNL